MLTLGDTLCGNADCILEKDAVRFLAKNPCVHCTMLLSYIVLHVILEGKVYGWGVKCVEGSEIFNITLDQCSRDNFLYGNFCTETSERKWQKLASAFCNFIWKIHCFIAVWSKYMYAMCITRYVQMVFSTKESHGELVHIQVFNCWMVFYTIENHSWRSV